MRPLIKDRVGGKEQFGSRRSEKLSQAFYNTLDPPDPLMQPADVDVDVAEGQNYC